MTSIHHNATTDGSGIRRRNSVASYLVRYRLGLFLLMGTGIATVVVVNWSWLVAAGLLPIIVGLLLCAAMCGLHLCPGNKSSNQSPGSMMEVPPPEI